MKSGEPSSISKLRRSWLLAMVAVLAVMLTAASCGRGPGLETTEETPIETTENSGFDINTPSGPGGEQADVGTPPVVGLGLPDAVASKSVLDNELTRATEAIRAVQSDAVLKLVSMKFINSFSDQTGLSTNYYIFSSAENPQYYYLVNVPRNGEKLKRFIMPVEDLELPFELLNLPFQYWKLSYIEAIKAAETQGAKEFIAQHPKFELSAILAQPAGQYLNWFLTYRATDGSLASLKIAVDSFAGKASVVR